MMKSMIIGGEMNMSYYEYIIKDMEERHETEKRIKINRYDVACLRRLSTSVDVAPRGTTWHC